MPPPTLLPSPSSPHPPPSPPLTPSPPSPPTIGDGPDYTEEAADIEEAISDGEEMEEGTYNVSVITAHKGTRPRWFLVHWEGFGPDDATWEKEADLGKNIVLEEYIDTHKLQRKKKKSKPPQQQPPPPPQQPPQPQQQQPPPPPQPQPPQPPQQQQQQPQPSVQEGVPPPAQPT